MYFSVCAIVVLIIGLWWYFKNKGPEKSTVSNLVKKAAKWATMAQQDTTPFVAVAHANYAHGYLQAVKDLATPKQIMSTTGVDIVKLEEHILNVQDLVNRKVIEKCPEFAGNVDLYLTAISQGASNDDDMY